MKKEKENIGEHIYSRRKKDKNQNNKFIVLSFKKVHRSPSFLYF